MATEVWAAPFALTGNWEYQGSDSSAGRLIEEYTVDFNHHADLTQLMTVDAAIRYDRRSQSDLTRQDVIPSLSYSINNYLFWFNLAATSDEQMVDGPGRDNNSNRTLAANWSSNWQPRLWLPAITANANSNWQDDANNPHLQDQQTKGAGGTVDWDLALFKLFYSYTAHDMDDSISGDESRSRNQLARASTDVALWDGKVAAAVSEQYTFITNDNWNHVENGVALTRAHILAAYSAAVQPNVPSTLSVNASLNDGNREVTAVAVVNNPIPPINVGLQLGPQSNADRLYLYAVDPDRNALPAGQSSAFAWKLYVSTNNLDWTEQGILSVSYNTLMKRFEFIVPALTKDYVKLVAVSAPPINTVNLTELEAYQAVAASGTKLASQDDQTTYQTDANLRLQLSPNLQWTSSGSYQDTTYSTSPDLITTNVNSGLAWTPFGLWTARLTGSYNTRYRDGLLWDKTKAIGPSLAFPILPTLESVVGVAKTWTEDEAANLTLGTVYTVQFIANLYTDLNARLNLALDQRENEQTGVDTEVTTSQLVLTARLVPGLVADWSSTYTKSDTTAGDNLASDLRLNWRPTDRLALRGGMFGTWNDAAGVEDTADLYAGFDVALTDVMQVSLTQRRELTPEAGNITALDWRWMINRYISMLTSGAVLYGGKRDEWNISSRLNARLSNF